MNYRQMEKKLRAKKKYDLFMDFYKRIKNGEDYLFFDYSFFSKEEALEVKHKLYQHKESFKKGFTL